MYATTAGRPRLATSRASAARMRSRGCMLAIGKRVLRKYRHVLVAAAREANEDTRAGLRRGPALRARKRMRALERRQNSFAGRELLERCERLVVAGRDVVDAADGLQQRVLRPDTGIIEPG